ncbi:MAG: PAS domain S-box protein [Sedimentisphaerales bacterium]|nr:PAS domain S-box protein [Sedimentisphaerales bacterium]
MAEKIFNILLVEDDEAQAALIARKFKHSKKPFELTIVDTPAQAIDYLDRESVDLIFVDIFHPDSVSVDTFFKGKLTTKYPIVVITDYGDEVRVVKTMKAGAMDYIVKSSENISDLPHVAERTLRDWDLIVKRRQAKQALRAANQQLTATNQQLTANEQQLRAANQQLSANEQQLRAANQQLSANEQQLRAANQQLSANEQQLRAANQQLSANEQQLRAANQQLTANEQQLRAANQQLEAANQQLIAAEQQLREEINRAQQYLDIAGAIILAINANGNVGLINQKGCEILGYSKEQILGKNWFSNFLPAWHRNETKLTFSKLMENNIGPVEHHENPIITSKGEEKLIAWHNTVIRDDMGNITGTLASGTDITEQRQAEKKLQEYQQQLRFLASELSLTEERQRRHMSTLLHDNIGQVLALSKIKLGSIRQMVDTNEHRKSMDELGSMIDEAIKFTRTLTFELSPPILYELGLQAALEWLVDKTGQQHGLEVNFMDSPVESSISTDIQVLFFQAVRELLINVAKHARASKVNISLKQQDDKIEISVTDNGIGFDYAKVKSSTRPAGFGLFNIRERLTFMGGDFQIDTHPAKGTTIKLSAPIKGE